MKFKSIKSLILKFNFALKTFNQNFYLEYLMRNAATVFAPIYIVFNLEYL